MPEDWGKAALKLHRMAWRAMCVAPRDGTYIRLCFRDLFDTPRPTVVAQWQDHTVLPAGGHWFDRDGNYVTPGPIAWQPEHGSVQ